MLSEGIFDFESNDYTVKSYVTSECIEKQIKKLIDDDDYRELDKMTELMKAVYTPCVFEYCAEKLAINCFAYLYAQRTKNQCKQDIAFRSMASNNAINGMTIDGVPRWMPQKRQVSNSAPRGYKTPWMYTVPESCFVIALNQVTDDRKVSRVKMFIKMLAVFRVPIGDVTLFTINSSGPKVQGYISMFTKYFNQGFNLYPGEIKNMSKIVSVSPYDDRL